MQKGFVLSIILFGTLIIIIAAIGGNLYLNKNKSVQKQQITTIGIPGGNSISKLNLSAVIKIPFVREGNIYLYEDGKEDLVVKPERPTTQTSCNNLVYPFLSPNGKYLAYIEQNGGQPGMGGCYGGILKIVSLDTGKIKTTAYETNYFEWNKSNELVFYPYSEYSRSGSKEIAKEVFYNPENNEESVYETVTGIASNGAKTLLSSEIPFNEGKLIKYKNGKYYFVGNQNNESFLFDKSQIGEEGFLDWSPSGKYAIFKSSKKSSKVFDAIELVLDTDNLAAPPKEIQVGRGGAGGDISTGRKWYFEKGFIAYCSPELYFVDGSQPLLLGGKGGGGCTNEEGLVATSPNSEYAFVNSRNGFELHTKNGGKQTIIETVPVPRSRGIPKNLIWINNDYMAIFERMENYDDGTGSKPRVFLFDRKANVIKPLIENAYLNSSM